MAAKTRISAGLALGSWLSIAPATAQSTPVVVDYGGPTETIIRERTLLDFRRASDAKVTYVSGNSIDVLAAPQSLWDS